MQAAFPDFGDVHGPLLHPARPGRGGLLAFLGLFIASGRTNHTHICLTDPEGRICEFTRDCHAFIARAVNAAHGDFESMWSSEQTSHVTCGGPDDLIAKIAYAMANPVAACLVKYGKNWPGVRAAWPAKARVVHRPTEFFRDKKDGGTWPDTAVLEFSRPPGYDGMSDEELAALIDESDRAFRWTCDRENRWKGFVGERFPIPVPPNPIDRGNWYRWIEWRAESPTESVC